jgi:hypothetical protein
LEVAFRERHHQIQLYLKPVFLKKAICPTNKEVFLNLDFSTTPTLPKLKDAEGCQAEIPRNYCEDSAT